MKFFFGISFSALLTFVISAWYISIDAESKNDVRVNAVTRVVKWLYDFNVKSLDVGLLKYLLISAPLFGVVALIIKISNKGPRCHLSKSMNYQLQIFESANWYEAAALWIRNCIIVFEDFLIGFVVNPTKLLDCIVEWVFLKFSAAIVGTYIGFVCASYYVDEIKFSTWFGLMFFSMALFFIIFANFFYYKFSDGLRINIDFYVLAFGVFWILFMAITLAS